MNDVLDFARPDVRLEWAPEWGGRTLRICWMRGANERWIQLDVEDGDLELSHRDFMRYVVGRALALLVDDLL
jgi:hypothetical protein